MAQLYDIEFAQGIIAAKYDSKGKMIMQHGLQEPIRLTALPYTTAMSYSKISGFKMTPNVPEARYRKKVSTADQDKFKTAAKKSERVERGVKTGEIAHVGKSVGTGKSSLQRAAETGDLSAAINK